MSIFTSIRVAAIADQITNEAGEMLKSRSGIKKEYNMVLYNITKRTNFGFETKELMASALLSIDDPYQYSLIINGIEFSCPRAKSSLGETIKEIEYCLDVCKSFFNSEGLPDM